MKNYILLFPFIFTIAYASTETYNNEQYSDYFNKANALFREYKHDESIIYYNKAIAANPTCHQAYFNRGIVFTDKGDLEIAKQNYRKAIELCPNYIKAHLMLGEALKQQQKYNEAVKEFETSLALDPNHFDAHLALGRIFCDMHNFEKSIDHFNKALAIHPHHAQGQLDFANTLNMVNQTEQALNIYKQLEKDAPNTTTILYNIAYTLKKLGRSNESFSYYKKVLALDQNHVEAHFSLGLLYLANGDFEKGWKEYEWRWKRPRYEERIFSVPQWDGSDITGKTIMLHAEQGLGDTFQFIRYAKVIKERYNATIIVAVQNPLLTLFAEIDYIDHIIALCDPMPPFDCHAPLMSLPLIMDTTIDTIPVNIPYLHANKTLVEEWKKEFAKDNHFNIGICWQGNPNYSTPFLRNAVAAKSIQLLDFEPISQIPGIRLYCLQKTTGEEQLQNLPEGFFIHQFGPNFDNDHGRFMDTAAVMKNLDLVITVDTSIAHLAGGLGVPVWILLPEPADWRWMYIPDSSPWYPTNMRLFRQPTTGDWKSVIQKIVLKLEKEIASQHTKKEIDESTHLMHELLEIQHKLQNIKEGFSSIDSNDEAFERIVKHAVTLCALRNAIVQKLEQINT